MIGANIALTLIVGTALGCLVWKYSPAPWAPMGLVGISLMCAGFVMWTIARFQLGSSFGVTAQARQFVTRGLYSKIRNPIYIFGSCVIAGLVLAIERPIWLLVFLAIIPMQMRRAGKEARVLEEKFGEQYRRYRAGTWC
jgi:protein-S-isoprenylcysteine O-methyltransferase Ste14